MQCAWDLRDAREGKTERNIFSHFIGVLMSIFWEIGSWYFFLIFLYTMQRKIDFLKNYDRPTLKYLFKEPDRKKIKCKNFIETIDTDCSISAGYLNLF